MSPLNLMTATVSLLAKSFSVLSAGNPARCARVFCSGNINPVKYLTTEATGEPKRPATGFIKFVNQERPLIMSQYPEINHKEIIRKLAAQWRMLSPEQKEPFKKATVLEMKQYKLDMQKFQAQLSPAQLQEMALEKKKRLKKRKSIQKKREFTKLGKPKCPRSAFNIFVSEHFHVDKGDNIMTKLKNLSDDWKNLSSEKKKPYLQLAEDDKIRYKNEIKSWEENMMEIGREDVIRLKTLSNKRKALREGLKVLKQKRPRQ